MQVEDWLHRIRLGEDSTLEFKRVVMRNETKVEGPHPDGLADELAAMANAQGGTLILGIDDKTRQVRFDEQAVPRSGIADANPLLAQAFLREGEGDANDQLQRLHLLADDDGTMRLSVAGALLCTSNPTRWLSSAYIQAVAYRGIANDPNEQVDAKDLDGPLDSQI